MLTMLDGKERRDCESRGFCSTRNVSANCDYEDKGSRPAAKTVKFRFNS